MQTLQHAIQCLCAVRVALTEVQERGMRAHAGSHAVCIWRTSGEDELSEYEKKRLRTISRNRAFLAQIDKQAQNAGTAAVPKRVFSRTEERQFIRDFF